MNNLPDDWLPQIKAIYPKRQGGQGWGALERLLKSHLSQGITWEEIMAGTRSYAAWVQYSGKAGSELVKQARTFYGRDAWFLEDYEIPTTSYNYRKPPPDETDKERAENQRKFDEQIARFKGASK